MNYPRMTCALCKRPTVPAVYIGNQAIGPKCARRANLLGPKAPRGATSASKVNKQSANPRCAVTLDLFAEELDNKEEVND